MARPERNNAEYFTHDADFRNDRRVKAIRSKFGAAGYGLLLMIMETLTDSEFTQLSTDEVEIELLSGDYGVSVTEIHSLLQLSEKIGFFARNEAGMLICPDLNKALEPVFEKRNRARLAAQNTKKPVTVTETPQAPPQSVTETPQSKEKESKEEEIESKEEERESEGKPSEPVIAADAAPDLNFLIDSETEMDLLDSLTETPSEAPHTGAATPQTLHQQMMDMYCNFYKTRIQLPPKIDGGDGNALKTITSYMRSVSKNKDDTGALTGWKWVFDNWGKLDSFLQTQLKLTQISSNLTNIIAQIQNGHAKSNGKRQTPKLALVPNGIESNGRKPFGNL